MIDFKKILFVCGALCFAMAVFQFLIGFSVTWSQYFGAPEILIQNGFLLFTVSLLIAALLALFGIYGMSGAGRIKALPFLTQGLFTVSFIFILRGLLVFPEILIVAGVLETAIAVPLRFVIFSGGAMALGLSFFVGTIVGRRSFMKED